MNRVELESFLKSFILFFLSLSILASFLVLSDYKIAKESLKSSILEQMRVCSYDLQCKQFDIDFVSNKNNVVNRLEKGNDMLYAYFPIEKSYEYILKLSYAQKRFGQDLAKIKHGLYEKLALILAILALLCVLFSYYALYPLRQALRMTKEFARDILHDFNTPLSVLRLNTGLLNKDGINAKKIERIHNSIDSILSLQENLRGYLDGVSGVVEKIELQALLLQRIAFLEKLFPTIGFSSKLEELYIYTNEDAIIRIIDNLLNNAAKYNKQNGSVKIILDAKEKKLIVQDTGVGIVNPKEVFKRFYIENKNGVGIGLHIVKKLCDELAIKIELQSVHGKGSTFELDLSTLTKR